MTKHRVKISDDTSWDFIQKVTTRALTIMPLLDKERASNYSSQERRINKLYAIKAPELAHSTVEILEMQQSYWHWQLSGKLHALLGICKCHAAGKHDEIALIEAAARLCSDMAIVFRMYENKYLRDKPAKWKGDDYFSVVNAHSWMMEVNLGIRSRLIYLANSRD